MPRLQPPPGYLTAKEAAARLGISDSLLSRYVSQNKLHRYGPEERKHKFYKESEVEALRETERLFTGEYEKGDYKKHPVSKFEQATPADMPAIVEISSRIFGDPPPLETRLAWQRKAPESFYVLRNAAGDIVGYTSVLALRRDTLERFVRDEISSEQITADDVEEYRPGRALHLYVMAIGIDPAYSVREKHEYGARLVAGLFSWLLDLAARGVEIETITARTYKPDGLRLLRKMGIPQLRSPVPDKALFSVRIPDSGFPMFVRYSEALLLAQHRAAAPALPVARAGPFSSTWSARDVPRKTPTGDRRSPLEVHRPEGTITYLELADELGITRTTLTEQLQKFEAAGYSYIKIPHPSRARETLRYLTPQQREDFLAWRARRLPEQRSLNW